MEILAALFFGTFLAEDLTSLTAGWLVQRGSVGAAPAIAATALGIYLGDLGLWVFGRVAGPRVLAWRPVAAYLTHQRVGAAAQWFNRQAAAIVLSSRFVPGSRLPLYVAAGACPGTFTRFAVWSAVAVAVWTPAVVLAASTGLVAATPVLALLGCRPLVARIGANRRARIVAAISRAWRWEFWPMWAFYPPVALWTAWLALRYGGFGTVSAANPGIEDGGIVGESKYEILKRLPPEWTVPSVRVAPGSMEDRLAVLRKHMETTGWEFPLVLKPDVGQRGTGMKVVRSSDEARDYLYAQRAAVLAQPLDPGPFEAGVFYYRKPSWPRGVIFSVTDKRFPVLVGDGTATVEDLIWAHPRYRMQAQVFLTRHEERRSHVLAAGETLPLARAGNHAQGTMFLDGSALMTPALESRIDEIARAFPGFFIGRFDVRYRDVASFRSGHGFAIVELNGATAEATDAYDPRRSLFGAYRILFRQWRLVFEIGAANRARGARSSSPRRLLELLRGHLTSRPVQAVSD